jgi:hypothetical protein
VRDLDDGGRLVGHLPGAAFTLRFDHSMYGGWVAERYEPSGRRLRRTTVRTENGAAAEYYAFYGQFRHDGDGWVVDAPPLELDRLPIRVDATGRPRVGGRELLGLVPDGHLVELRVTSR